MIKSGESIKEVAINNAILDFSKKCNLFRKDNIFEISFDDSVFHKTVGLFKIDDRTFAWKRGALYTGIIAVGISGHRICEECEELGLKFQDRYFYTEETTVGSKGKLPSRYIEKNGKLFYWWDKDYPLTEDMLAVLWKYDLLFDNTNEFLTFPQFSTNDKQKGAHYYFCKNDLSIFKKVVTNRAIGFYDPPEIKCK